MFDLSCGYEKVHKVVQRVRVAIVNSLPFQMFAFPDKLEID